MVLELLRISETKMKITLDRADMEKYRVDAGAIDYGKRETRKAFWGILDEVKLRTGFDVSGGKALIQCYPSRDGGCELFVTKLGAFPEVTERAISRSGNAAMLSAGRCVYLFGKFSDLLFAVRAVNGEGGNPPSDLYAGEDGGYYLVLEERDPAVEGGISRSARLSEYGKRLFPKNEKSALIYLGEHARRLTDGDAMKKLSFLI